MLLIYHKALSWTTLWSGYYYFYFIQGEANGTEENKSTTLCSHRSFLWEWKPTQPPILVLVLGISIIPNPYFKPFSKQAPRKPGSQAAIHPSWLAHRLTKRSSTITSGLWSHSHSFLTKLRLWYHKLCPVAFCEKITLKLPNLSLKTSEYPPQMFTL